MIGKISSFRASSRRRWLVLLLLALLADLSASAAVHRHPAPDPAPTTLEQGSHPGSKAPGSPLGGLSLDDVCALCGALAGGTVACTSRVPLDLAGALTATLGSVPDLILWASAGWWDSTASRGPPRLLF